MQELPGNNLESEAKFGKAVYTVDGKEISVNWKEVVPGREKAFVFLPGWSAGGSLTIEDLCKEFGQEGESAAFSITTNPEGSANVSQYQEAQAIKQFLEEIGVKDLVLGGHSAGGSKAVDLVDILQRESPETKINGLVLLGPVGLYDQGKMELAAKFAQDSTLNTPITVAKNLLQNPGLLVKALQAGTDIVFNIAREIGATKGIGYPQRFLGQLREMVTKNTRLDEIRCPVVLIQGEEDPVSSPEKTVPGEDRNLWSTRRRFLKDAFFPNAADVSMLVAKKLGHHGFPHFRPEQVAKTAMYLLNRHKETKGISYPISPTSDS